MEAAIAPVPTEAEDMIKGSFTDSVSLTIRCGERPLRRAFERGGRS